MPISPAFDKTLPADSDPANTVAAEIRKLTSQLEQIVNQIKGVAESTPFTDPVTDGTAIKNLSQLTAALASILSGGGTAGRLARWSSATGLGASAVSENGGILDIGSNIFNAANQPYFRTVKASNQVIAVSEVDIVITFPNQGSHFSGNQFTAPVAGLYLIGADINITGTGSANTILNMIPGGGGWTQNLLSTRPGRWIGIFSLNAGAIVNISVLNVASANITVSQTSSNFWGIKIA